MRYKNIFDLHTHSIHSFDGHDSCVDICNGASGNGAIGIAITDHCDIDGKDFDYLDFAEKQMQDVIAAKNEYDGMLTVLSGIELGQGIYRKAESLDLLSKFDYDIVIGSIHNLEDMEDYYFIDYSKVNIDELLRRYFLAELELAQWNVADTLAHLTYPLRYIVEREHISVDLTNFYDIIDAIFETLIRNDKALEVNTSGLFMDIGSTLPGVDLVSRYKDKGGKLVTVGSDSHYKEKMCQGIESGYDMLRECGYSEFTIFKNRVPQQLPLK